MAFFMRKGADCLSKWVGESERQLRLLFEQAQQMKPSIIFFDEIDGLAPVRSTKQDQIHASIVSTLLALMDGLSDRGQVMTFFFVDYRSEFFGLYCESATVLCGLKLSDSLVLKLVSCYCLDISVFQGIMQYCGLFIFGLNSSIFISIM